MVFGRVIQGYEDVVKKIENTPKGSNDRPVNDCIIADCGVWTEALQPFEATAATAVVSNEDIKA